MDLSSFLGAPGMVQVHAASAAVALAFGGIQLLRARRDVVHRRIGWAWFVAMGLAVATSFFIRSLAKNGPVAGFSPIHLLSVLSLVSMLAAILYARRGDVRRHRLVMILLFWLGLVLPGLFTLLPGRVMHQVVFG